MRNPAVRFLIACLTFVHVLLPLYAYGQSGNKPFDDGRNALIDFEAAQTRAKAEHKNILLNFGANWCQGCLAWDAFSHENAEISKRLGYGYIVLHVTTGVFFDSKPVATLRKRYPKFRGIPHLMIVANDGNLLRDFDYDRDIADMKTKQWRTDTLIGIFSKYIPASSSDTVIPVEETALK